MAAAARRSTALGSLPGAGPGFISTDTGSLLQDVPAAPRLFHHVSVTPCANRRLVSGRPLSTCLVSGSVFTLLLALSGLVLAMSVLCSIVPSRNAPGLQDCCTGKQGGRGNRFWCPDCSPVATPQTAGSTIHKSTTSYDECLKKKKNISIY